MIAHMIALCGGLTLTALLAVASDAAGETPDASTLIIALLGLVGVLDRIARWAYDNRKLLTVALNTLVKLRDHGDTRQKVIAEHALRQIEVELVKHNRGRRAIFAKLRDKALRDNGHPEDTRTPTKKEKIGNVAKDVLSFLPVVGRFFR